MVASVTGVAFLADVTEGVGRTRAFGLAFAAAALARFTGNALGGVLAAPVAALIGAPVDDVAVYRPLLSLALAIGLLSGVPILLVRSHERPPPLEAPRRWRALASFAAVWMLIGFGAGNFFPYLNLFFAERFGLAIALVGLLVGARDVGGALGAVAHTRLTPSRGVRRAVAAAWAASLPLTVVAAFAPSAWIAAPALVLRGTLMDAAQPTFDALRQAAFPARERSGVGVALLTTWYVAYGAGAFVAGQVRAAVGPEGYTANLLTLAAAYLCAIATFLLVIREPVESRS